MSEQDRNHGLDRILLDVCRDQLRVGVVERGHLVELYMERPGKHQKIGAIYKGRVANVLPGMQAAFVDIGLNKNAFLHASDLQGDTRDFRFDGQGQDESPQGAPIEKLVQVGQTLLVQVIKEPGGSKGPRVTANITLPGRLMVLAPTMQTVGVSRRIEDEGERNRLRSILERCKPGQMGAIVRTASVGCQEEDFFEDIERLTSLWQEIARRADRAGAPSLVFQDGDLLNRTVRDLFTDRYDEFVVNDKKMYELIKTDIGRLSPKLLESVHFHPAVNLFSVFGVEHQAEQALNRRVWLKSGGYLVIDHTEALTAIDVNTGKYVGERDLGDTVYRLNLEAVDMIVRQLRLRDIGGIIVIDFIDMQEPQHKQDVVEALRAALRSDRNKTNVVGLTGLGLVEMTRKKVRQPLSASVQQVCPLCDGSGLMLTEEAVAARVYREMDRHFDSAPGEQAALVVHVCADVAIWLAAHGGALGHTVYLCTDERMARDSYRVQPLIGEPPATGRRLGE